MSIRLMSAIFESTTLGPTERLIMLALADHADDDGRCYPSIARLCQRTGLSERAIQTNVRKLVDMGFIHIVVGGGKGNANLYFIAANPAADAPRRKCTPAADAPQTPQQMHLNPAADAPEPSRTIIEPSEYPPLVPPDEISPDQQQAGSPPRKPPKRACAIPPDWTPSDRNLSDARDRNFTEAEIHEQAGAFRDYHLARGTTFKDWDAAWRTWLGNARRYGRASQASKPRAGTGHDGLLAGFQRAAAKRSG